MTPYYTGYPDPNTAWIIETDASKAAFAGVLLQPHTKGGITQEVPVTFISCNFTRTQQAWSTTKCELSTIFVAKRKLHYYIKGCKVAIRTDHKPLLEIVSEIAKNQNTAAAADKLYHWTADTLAGNLQPTMEYKKGSLNLIMDSLSRLRMGEHYYHIFSLKNMESIKLEKKAEVKMVTTDAKSVEQRNVTQKLPDLQVKVWDIFKMSDK